MTTKTKATHVMATPRDCERLRSLSVATRIPQSEFLREVARHVIEVYGQNSAVALPPQEEKTGLLEDLVFRLPPAHIAEIKALADRTRVRRSEYLRVGLSVVLDKYEVHFGLGEGRAV